MQKAYFDKLSTRNAKCKMMLRQAQHRADQNREVKATAGATFVFGEGLGILLRRQRFRIG